jgi:hypothetical protein
MLSTTIRRTLTASLSGPLVAAGIIFGSMVIGESATAHAQPMTDNQCTSMTMADGKDMGNPNALTGAAPVGAASAPNASDGSMPANCMPANQG